MDEETSFTLIILALIVAVVAVAIAIMVGVIRNGDNYHDERVQLREMRLEVIDVCQKELDTDLQECVDRNVKLLEAGTP